MLKVPGGGFFADASHEPGTPRRVLLKRHFTGASLVRLRPLVEDTAAAEGLTGVRLGEFILAVSEVAANAVEHAGGQGHLELRRLADELECRITDNGPGFTPAIPVLPGLDTARPGRGLWLARLVTDRLAIAANTTGSAVTLAMRVH
ncbi:ATP-binding protein [Streptomyces sp. NPDC002845]